MRYEARWSNGYWKVFDTREYTDVAICRTHKECNEAVAKFNAR